jgi:protoporphyrinogen oxidase
MESKIIIIGGGISGLALAYNLELMKTPEYTLFEAAPELGGLCGSYALNGFTFDYSGHLLHINTKAGLKLIQKLLGKNVSLHKRRAYVHIYGKEVPFPLQNNLYGLDDALVSECVKGALEAYKDKKIKDTGLFKNWALALYGEGICRHFMFPYNQKLWQTDLSKMTSAWCGKFVPSSALEDIIKGAYSRRKKDFGYNAHFFYPKTGGCAALIKALAQKAKNINLNSEVTKIDLKNKTVIAAGRRIAYGKLASTMPLNKLGRITEGLSDAVKKDFEALRHNSVYTLNLGFKGKTKDGHWYYFPEGRYTFYRVGVQSAFSAGAVPESCSSLYIEFAAAPGRKQDLKELETKALKQLFELGFIEGDAQILAASWVEIPAAYPIYDINYETARKNITDFLAEHGVTLLGRYGAWEYSFMEKSLLDAAQTAEALIK